MVATTPPGPSRPRLPPHPDLTLAAGGEGHPKVVLREETDTLRPS